jgi:hypothetical protein
MPNKLEILTAGEKKGKKRRLLAIFEKKRPKK